jgi:microcin C transport system permease protein
VSTIATPAGAPKADGDARATAAAKPLSPNQRAWARFRRNRIGLVSLWVFLAMLVTATFAEVVSNDRPIVARIGGQWHAPMFANPGERGIGGDFDTGTDWKDPFVADVLARPGNWALFTVNAHSATSTDYFSPEVSPSPPTASNWIGTDAQVLRGYRFVDEEGRQVAEGNSYDGRADQREVDPDEAVHVGHALLIEAAES